MVCINNILYIYITYKKKYLKYKLKYLNLKKKLYGGMEPSTPPSIQMNPALPTRTNLSNEYMLDVIYTTINKQFNSLVGVFEQIKSVLINNYEDIKCLFTICDSKILDNENKENQIRTVVQKYYDETSSDSD